MKAVTGPMSFLVIMFMGIIFLILGFALFYGILKAAPNQLAFASVQRLGSAIQETCITGEPVDIEFSMQQSKPLITDLGPVPLRMFTKSKIREFGDPDFVLYYESFPPGEGIAWEVYHDFGPRAVLVLPGIDEKDLDKWNAEKIKQFIEEERLKIKDETKDKYPDVTDPPVVISNIELTPDIDLSTGEKVAEKDKGGFFGFGDWTSQAQGDRIFKFTNYMDLPRLDKTLVKYMSCGENKLCMKTAEGIYAFPLDACKGKIEMVQTSYEKSNWEKARDEQIERFTDFTVEKWASQGPLGAFGHADLLRDSYKYRTADLSLASPCKIKATVELTNCDNKCDKFNNDPIYYYNAEDDKLEKIGEHYTCLDEMRGDKNIEQPNEGGEVKCVKIDISEKDGHCYTYNSDRGAIDVKLTSFLIEKPLDVAEGVTRGLGKLAGLGGNAAEKPFDLVGDFLDETENQFIIEPVKQSTEYIKDGDAYLLTQAAMSDTIFNTFENINGALRIYETPDEWWWP